jgi:hypothetical protein
MNPIKICPDSARTALRLAKTGTAIYLLWAALHVTAGISMTSSALADINRHLREVASALPPARLPLLAEGTAVSAIAAFHSFNMVWLGALVGAVAVALNRRNSAAGFWLNLVIAGMLDVGLFAFLLLPGYLAWRDGLVGPTLFLLALLFTGAARFAASKHAPLPRPLNRAHPSEAAS